MYVCHCQAVTDRELHDAIEAGARDCDELARRCGAGATCGGCRPAIERLLAEHRDRHAPTLMVAATRGR